MRHFISINLAMILPISVLTACGGGSSSNDAVEEENKTDNVATFYRVGGTASGALSQGLTLANNGSDSLSVTGENFEFSTQLSDGDDYNVTVTAHPDQQLCSATNATGVIAGADVDNVAVHCRHWGAASLIENTSLGHARFPQIGADNDGNLIAVFLVDDGGFRSLYASYYNASTGSWGAETLLENGSAGYAGEPDVAFDDNGNAIVVWAQNDGTRYNIYANHYSASTGSWGTETLIESGNAGDAYAPQIAFDNSGNAIVVWRQHDGTYDSIYANRYTPAGGWGSEELIESGSEDVQNPIIAVDHAGNAIVGWSQSNSAYHDILINRYTPTGGWGTAATIAIGNNGNGGALDPQLAIDATGNATLVWREFDGSKSSIYANRYTASTDSWGTEVLIESGDNGNASNPQVAVDNDGNAIAVWQQNEISIKNSVYTNRYSASTDSWGTEVLIESGEEGSAFRPKIAINNEGNALVVWTQDDSASDNLIYANRYLADTDSWGTEALIENTTDGSDGLQFVMDNAGNATIVDYRYDGTYLNVHANRFE